MIPLGCNVSFQKKNFDPTFTTKNGLVLFKKNNLAKNVPLCFVRLQLTKNNSMSFTNSVNFFMLSLSFHVYN